QELRDALRGELLQPGDEQYDEAKRLWNGAHDGSEPAMVARCTGAADVIAALGFARANDLEVAVRGGGHSVAGLSTSDGGMVIDLSPIRNVRVDPDARVAYVGPGAVWGDVDHEAQQFGLATTGGLVSTTGVAGFTLGGGIGWLMREYRLACDNLVGADGVHGGRRTRSVPRSPPARCSCRVTPPATCCGPTAIGRRRLRTRSRQRSASPLRRPCRRSRRNGTARMWRSVRPPAP